MISVVKGIKQTKLQILIYTVAFVVATLLLSIFGYTGYTYFVVMALLGIYWIRLGIRGQGAKDINAWAHKMFHFSLVILLAFSVMISIDAWLP